MGFSGDHWRDIPWSSDITIGPAEFAELVGILGGIANIEVRIGEQRAKGAVTVAEIETCLKGAGEKPVWDVMASHERSDVTVTVHEGGVGWADGNVQAESVARAVHHRFDKPAVAPNPWRFATLGVVTACILVVVGALLGQIWPAAVLSLAPIVFVWQKYRSAVETQPLLPRASLRIEPLETSPPGFWANLDWTPKDSVNLVINLIVFLAGVLIAR